MKNLFLATFVLFLCSCGNSTTENQMQEDTTTKLAPAPIDILDTTGGKGVFFENLTDSQVLKSPFTLKMRVVGMEVEKAGPINELKGHHHVIIDGSAVEEGQTVINDENHLHFGQGQTEAELKLSPGFHTLTLQFANGVHASYGERWSRTLHVQVK